MVVNQTHEHKHPPLDRVTLPDGEVVFVARGNLAAAKALYAAQKRALRRVALMREQIDASDPFELAG